MNCGFAAALLAHVGLARIPLLKFGTDEQKRDYLGPALARREARLLRASRSRARAPTRRRSARRPSATATTYVINGSKMFITNGNDRRLLHGRRVHRPHEARRPASARSSSTRRRPASIVSKKLRRPATTRPRRRRSTFENLRVPASALLGGIEGGFEQVTGTLEGGRITHAARSVGVSQAALEAALGYARRARAVRAEDRQVPGHQVQARAHGDGGRDGAHRRCGARPGCSTREPCMREAAMAKLFASEVAQRVTWEAMQIHGGYGYITEFPVERYWRDARLMTITEGTTRDPAHHHRAGAGRLRGRGGRGPRPLSRGGSAR